MQHRHMQEEPQHQLLPKLHDLFSPGVVQRSGPHIAGPSLWLLHWLQRRSSELKDHQIRHSSHGRLLGVLRLLLC